MGLLEFRHLGPLAVERSRRNDQDSGIYEKGDVQSHCGINEIETACLSFPSSEVSYARLCTRAECRIQVMGHHSGSYDADDNVRALLPVFVVRNPWPLRPTVESDQ